MRLLGRTLIIFAAALVVVGATVAVARLPFAAGLASRGPDQFERGAVSGVSVRGESQPVAANDSAQASAPERLNQGNRPEGFRPERGSRSGLFGLLEVGRSFVIIAVIVALVVLASRMFRRVRPVRSAQRRVPPRPESNQTSQ